jgi:CRP-like cAMP-binding protein
VVAIEKEEPETTWKLAMNDTAAGTSLFLAGGLPDSAALVGEGLCRIEMHGTVPFSLPVQQSLVGAEEMLLTASKIVCEKRLYSAYLEQGAVERTCPREEVLTLVRQFEFGFTQNRFTSQLLQRATQSFIEDKQSLVPEERAHEERALAFTSFLVALKNYADTKKHAGILPLVAGAAGAPFFELGVKLRRERFLTSLRLSSLHMPKKAERISGGTVLCQEGDPARCMYVLLEGKIAVLQSQKVVARIQEPGEAFGEMALFLEGKRTARLVAEMDSAVFLVKEDDMPEFHRSHPEVFFNVGATLAQRLQATLKGIRSVSDRKANKGLYLAEQIAEGKREVSQLWARLEGLRSIPRNVEFEIVLDDYRATLAV